MTKLFVKTCLFLIINCSIQGAAIAHNSVQQTAQLSAMIIGSGSPKYNSDRAGPAVLITYGDTVLLVDTGNGTQAHLAELGLPIKELDGLLFTHHHLDHNEEFIPIFIRSLLGGNQFKLVGPPPMAKMNSTTLALYKTDIEYRMRRSKRTLEEVVKNYQVKEIRDQAEFYIGKIKITTTKVNHTIDTIAYRFEAGGHSVVVSGDLSYSESLPVLAKNSDVLIIDSGGTIKVNSNSKRNRRTTTASPSRNNQRQRAHVTLEETAKMASDANVKKLVLTHFTEGDNDEAATTKELRKSYQGQIVFADDLMTVTNTAIHSSKKTTAQAMAPVERARKNTDFTVRPTNPCTVNPYLDNRVNVEVNNGFRQITANAIPNHKIGTFPNSGNPNTLSAQNRTYNVTLTPKISHQLTYLYDQAIDYGRPNYIFGVALNGVKFEPMANEYFYGSDGNNYQWTVEALSPYVFLGDDCNNAHIQPNGEYHYHGTPTGLIDSLNDNQAPNSMMLVGWAADGFPIYYAWGPEQPDNINSTLIALKPSYELRQGDRPGDGKTAPDGEYNGLYVRDYVYRDKSGDLDQCNGREGVTPEFPNGTYYYILSDTFPFVGRCLVGEPSPDFKIGGAGPRQGPQNNNQSHPELPRRNTQKRPDPEKIMVRMDQDGDKKISRAEARGRLKDNFARRDKNNDGFITLSELTPSRRPD